MWCRNLEEKMDKTKKVYTSFLYRLKPAQMMVLGFASVILLGALFLMMPLATNSANSTSFIDCLFTATSAVCVTGLVVVDTSIHWSIFGKVVIIILIQIGGLGFMAISASIALIFGKKINLRQRILIKEALNQNHLSGSVRLIITVIKFTFIIEAIGAILLSTVFIPQFGWIKGIGFSIFHAISGFCNAGFDLMGNSTGAFSSITSYYNNPIVVFTISALIILGGIGFGVMVCVVSKRKFRDYDLSSKLAIITTIILLLAGTALIFFGEYSNKGSLANLNMWDKFQVSFFQSVTTRTAGYTTIDFTHLRESTLFIMIILMFIGASPASTGGGIKTTTMAVIVMEVRSFIKNKNEITVFKKSINKYTFRKALGVFVIAVVTVVTSTYLLTVTQGEKFNLLSSAFEAASAFATVGLSLAGSYNLNLFGKILIIFLMFAGRVGSLTVFTIFLHEPEPDNVRYPEGKVLVG